MSKILVITISSRSDSPGPRVTDTLLPFFKASGLFNRWPYSVNGTGRPLLSHASVLYSDSASGGSPGLFQMLRPWSDVFLRVISMCTSVPSLRTDVGGAKVKEKGSAASIWINASANTSKTLKELVDWIICHIRHTRPKRNLAVVSTSIQSTTVIVMIFELTGASPRFFGILRHARIE
jgi:hypothetical protein